MTSWSIGHAQREQIEVELLSSAANDCGYDWVSTRAHVAVEAFRADIPMLILATDLRRFREALLPVYRDLDGIAEFTTIEDQLYLKVEIDRVGHVQVTGYVKDDASFGNRLTFELQFDQTMLRGTLSELSHALSVLEESAV